MEQDDRHRNEMRSREPRGRPPPDAPPPQPEASFRSPQEGAARVRLGAVTGLALLTLASSACSVGDEVKPVAPVAELPTSFLASGRTPLSGRWWESLDDPELSLLVERALAGSPTLAQTWDRLRQAEAVVRREGADELPGLDLDASAEKAYSDVGDLGEEFSVGFAASYELDLWGRVRAASAGARFDLQAREAELEAAAITLSAEVAQAWYELLEQRALRNLLNQQIETNERILELTELRFRQGQAELADVLRQRQLVEQRRGEIEDVRAAIATREHQLAVLLGHAPRSLELPARDGFAHLPPLPETGMPIELIRRRPDVRQAFHDVQAADARIAAAIAEQYPRIDLSVPFTSMATRPGDLFSTWLATLVAQLTLPLFDAGERAAEVDRTRAVLSERLNVYEEQVLEALREVEDALAREIRQRDKVASLERQLELADQTVERLTDRYVQGNTDFLDVLDALDSQQDVAQQLITARRQHVQFRIDLGRALAGGWEMSPPEPRRLVREDDDRHAA